MGRSERIDHDIEFLLGDADDLAETLPEWDEVSEDERGIWQFGWPNDLAILEHLERSYRAGEMSDEQERSYERLGAKLRELAPAIDKTPGLRVPPSVNDG